MSVSANPFAAAAAAAVAESLGLDAAHFVVGAPPKPEMGDYAVGCFPAAKAKKQAPAKLAQEVAAGFAATELLSSATAAGPFVNFTVNRTALYRYLAESTRDECTLIPRHIGAEQTVCIDYSSPNISKHLAYHHIRSTVIGHVLANLYRAVGYRVIGINHLGDWGTTHGMLLAGFDMWGIPEPLTISTLNDMYVRFRAAAEDDSSLNDKAREWFRRLEDGDEVARERWQRFRDVSWAEFDEVYRQLGITFDEVRGESAYEDDMADVLQMLADKGLSSRSEGALVVAFEDESMVPMLLRKQDGATLYATRDLAAALYRWNSYHFSRSLYVVDRGQGLHFKQLFTTLAMAGYDWADRCKHVPFGLIRLGGKKTGTRTGNVVLLKDVLSEATERALAVVQANNQTMAADLASQTAEDVGIGAVVFANLSSQREKDIDFEWEAVLSTAGESGPYIQYAHARCASIMRKATPLIPSDDFALLTTDAEWSLARKLLEFGDIVARAADHNEPHTLSRYLLDVSSNFARWYTSGNQDKALRVITDDEAMTRARLALVAATRTVLATGLGILGIAAPTVM